MENTLLKKQKGNKMITPDFLLNHQKAQNKKNENTVEHTVCKLPPESTHYAITFTKPAVIEITDKDKNVHKYDVIELLDGLFELIKHNKGQII